jgi:GTP-binding protein
VGKSTLFNRLYGRRRAITDPTPGVTRDAIEEQCSLAGIPITLVDTGGVKVDYDEVFDDIVAGKSLSSLDQADLILFLVQVGEITAEDELIVEALRARSDRVILVANKADTVEKEYLASEFYSLGLGEPIPVSSAHGRNMDKLAEIIRTRLETIIEEDSFVSDHSPAETEETDLVLALVGKPNAGKSTLANRLSGEEYSLVSDIAGTTRDTVIASTSHKGRRLKIVDTAGIRRKAKVAENVEYYSVNRAIRAMFEADVTVLLIDSDEGLSDQDKKITAQAVKKGRAVIMAMNKWDEKVPDKKRLKKSHGTYQVPVPGSRLGASSAHFRA